MRERTADQRRKHAEAERKRRADGKVNDAEWRKAWRAANPEKVREMNRKAGRKYAQANPEAERARREKFRAENPEYWRERREAGRAYEAAYRARHPEMRSWRQRKARRSGIVLTVRVTADICGVCLGPLFPDRRYPDPLATTVGHEPPLIMAAREGWTVTAERPEHLRCNLWKGPRSDAELVGHAAIALLTPSQSVITEAAA